MRSLSYTGQFKRDIKLVEKRGKDLSKLRNIVGLLLAGNPLPREFNDHPLKGDWRPRRDLHIEPDWILIYFMDTDVLRLERTGTHTDLFR
jgi:mRNA interferase YafQ